MKKLIPELRRKGSIPSNAVSVGIDIETSVHFQEIALIDFIKIRKLNNSVAQDASSLLIAAACEALKKSAIVVQFETYLNVEFVCCCTASQDFIQFEFFDTEGSVTVVKMDMQGMLSGAEHLNGFCRQCLVAAAAIEGRTPFIYDEIGRNLKLRKEFAKAVEKNTIHYDRLFEDAEAGDATRSFADFVMYSSSVQIRIHEAGIASSFVPDAFEHLSNLSHAIKYSADDAFLDRVESLAEKPELIEKAGLVSRAPGDRVWLEMPHPDQEDGVIGFYVESNGLDAKTGRVKCFHKFDALKPELFRVQEFDVDFENLNSDHPYSGLLIAAFALLAAPGVFRQHHIDPETDRTHLRINRRLGKMGIPNSPYILVECVVDIDREAAGGRFVETAAWFQARRRRHRVRGFWRWKLQKLEFVREHFRGSEEIGTVDKRYRLTSSADA